MKKRREDFLRDAPQVLLNPVPYAHGSHLCVARYPKADANIYRKSQWPKCLVKFSGCLVKNCSARLSVRGHERKV